MNNQQGRVRKRRIIWLIASVVVIVVAFCGCQSVSFYRQAIGGELHILTHQTPIKELLADTNTPPALRHKFEVVLQVRQFAQTNLHLPADESYLKYVDLHREFAVWNVNAAPPLSLEPKRWWYPFVGSASYRGYFAKDAATKYANQLKKKGFEVYLGAVETYSTLGWFHDPVLNTFIVEPDADLAEILFHELAHQRLFISGDTDFNEAFATAVGEEGVRRWLRQDPAVYQKFQVEREQEGDFVNLILASRDELEAVYNDPSLTDTVKLQRKAQIIAEMRNKHEQLKAKWGGKSYYNRWFSTEINNAKLNTISAYYTLVPAFRALLQANGGDMERFYSAVEKLGKMPKKQRHDVLKQSLQKTVSSIDNSADFDALHAPKINRTLASETR
ncbi:MAG: aminopeptidase [Limisphaerales bacterium]